MAKRKKKNEPATQAATEPTPIEQAIDATAGDDKARIEAERQAAMDSLGTTILQKMDNIAEYDKRRAAKKAEAREMAETLNEMRKDLDEDQRELAKLAAGGHAERLPLKARPKPSATPEPAPDQAMTGPATLDIVDQANAVSVLRVGSKLEILRAPTSDNRFAFGIKLALNGEPGEVEWHLATLFKADQPQVCDEFALNFARARIDRVVKDSDGNKRIEVAAAELYPAIAQRERQLSGEQIAA